MKSEIEFMCISEDSNLPEVGEYFLKEIKSSVVEYSKKGEYSINKKGLKSKMKNRNSSLIVTVIDEESNRYNEILVEMLSIYKHFQNYFSTIEKIADFQVNFYEHDGYAFSFEFSTEVLQKLEEAGFSLPVSCYRY
ncbi:hypothetical protein [Treponema zioleckii]|uniref:hypothetical protein n=1 Tax=Treponema zioleckii TaxID=331680 RepID=UPI00168B4587|nr:hypothetical protein [Treponema zioleckii]